MTNFGFLGAMEAAGIQVEQTNVGDRYVLEAILKHEWNLEGEQSGHVIWTDFPTGDGIAASLLTLRALDGRRLEEVETFERLPQRLESVRVADRSAIEGAKRLWSAVEEEGLEAGGKGRVLVRPSGTEPLVRVMVEAPSEEECEAICDRLVAVVGTSWDSPCPYIPQMCGIVGYVGDRPCRDLLIAGLEKLEYRGYDSAGVSVISDGEIDSVRAVGNLANLAALERSWPARAAPSRLRLRRRPSASATRWATHGRVTEENAHPHGDCEDKIHIVLNGIIENHAELGAI